MLRAACSAPSAVIAELKRSAKSESDLGVGATWARYLNYTLAKLGRGIEITHWRSLGVKSGIRVGAARLKLDDEFDFE